MKSFLLILVLSLSTFQALSQVNKPCFTVPQTVSITELNSIQLSNDCMITSFSFQLFNRWGELLRESNKMTNPLIFGTNEPESTKIKRKKKKKNSAATLDKPLAQGVYFFIITYTLPGKNEPEKQTGNITFY
jgi:hypothetical protein